MVRAVVACVLVVLIFVPVGAASASVQVVPAALIQLGQQTPTPRPGPTIEQPPSQQDAANSRQRLIIGISALVLLGIVILGHRARRGRGKKKDG